jgi:prolyl oligopeptidase
MTVVYHVLLFAACLVCAEPVLAIDYPPTRRVDHVDTYHGSEVADPYRWLEADVRQSDEVAQWVEAQSQFAEQYLQAIPVRETIRKRLTEIYNYERFSPPVRKGPHYLYQRNDGLQDQAVLYVADSATDTGRVLIDPNRWSDDGTVALADFSLSDDGALLAYAKSAAGSDWKTIHVLEVATGRELPDMLSWHRFGGIEWNEKGDGFWYSRYPEPVEGQEFQTLAVNKKIYFHRLGDEQSQDQLVYEDIEHPDWSFGVSRADDLPLLVLAVYRGTDPQNMVKLLNIEQPGGEWQTIVADFEHQYSFVGSAEGRLFFVTDDGAPTKRLVSTTGDGKFAEVVSAADATIESASLVGGKLLVEYLDDVKSRVKLFALDGTPAGEIALPGEGTAGGFTGEFEHSETFYTFTNLVTPAAIYRYDFAAGTSQAIRKPSIDFDADKFVARQVFVTSRDGTRVPMTIAHRKGLAIDGNRPTLLYAYGGFSISILPAFSADYAVWMEMGGVVAIANLRGGGEYGEAWHQAGKLNNKQNVFDDFIAAGEWLIENGITNKRRLACRGGSNGGLLVGAVLTQRPDLWGACLPAVGVHDMLRFHKFTAGQFWRDEYGSSDNAEQFKTLFAYSPYHNVEQGVDYPATMITTADTDDRVVPMHSFKFGAALQHAQAGDAPVLLRVETRAGHGAGTPTSKRIDQAADAWAFCFKQFGYVGE